MKETCWQILGWRKKQANSCWNHAGACPFCVFACLLVCLFFCFFWFNLQSFIIFFLQFTVGYYFLYFADWKVNDWKVNDWKVNDLIERWMTCLIERFNQTSQCSDWTVQSEHWLLWLNGSIRAKICLIETNQSARLWDRPIADRSIEP